MIFKSLQDPTNLGASFSRRVYEAGFWAVALRGTDRVLGLIRTIILARLLAPEDFGLFGICMLTMAALETFSQTGFQQAIIRKKGESDTYLNTAWTVQILRGFSMAVFLYVTAPYIANFFLVPGAVTLLQVTGLVMLLSGFTNIAVLNFQKDLDFQKQFFFTISGVVAEFAVGIPAALILRSAWALVLGMIARHIILLIASYIVHDFRPHLNLNKAKIKELYSFGIWVFSSGVLVFLCTQGDALIVGRLLGAEALGIYQVANRIAYATTTEISHLTAQVALPAYSMLQDDFGRLKKACLNTFAITFSVSLPVAALFLILGTDLVSVMLGNKWMAILPVAQILILAGILRVIAATAGTLFLAIGRPKIDTYSQVIRALVLFITIYPLLVKWNTVGVAVAILLSIFASILVFLPYLFSILTVNLTDLLRSVLAPFACVAVSASAMFCLLGFLEEGLIRLLVLGVIGGVVYLTTMWLIKKMQLT